MCSLARRLVNVSSEGEGGDSDVELRKRPFVTKSDHLKMYNSSNCFSRAAQTRSWKLTKMGVPIRAGVTLDYLQPAFCHLDLQSTLFDMTVRDVATCWGIGHSTARSRRSS